MTEMIDWTGFRFAMEHAANALIGTKEVMRNVQEAFRSLQTSFEGEFPCIAALMLEDTETWASNTVMTGVVRIVMDANRLVTSVTQDDRDSCFTIKDEFTEPVRVQVVLLEPITHEVAYRFPPITVLRGGDQVWLVDTPEVPKVVVDSDKTP